MENVMIYGWRANDLLDRYEKQKDELFRTLDKMDISYLYITDKDELYIGEIVETTKETSYEEVIRNTQQKVLFMLYRIFEFWHPKTLPELYVVWNSSLENKIRVSNSVNLKNKPS